MESCSGIRSEHRKAGIASSEDIRYRCYHMRDEVIGFLRDRKEGRRDEIVIIRISRLKLQHRRIAHPFVFKSLPIDRFTEKQN